MSKEVVDAFENAKQKVKNQRSDRPVPVIKTPWDDAISEEEQKRNNSKTRPDSEKG